MNHTNCKQCLAINDQPHITPAPIMFVGLSAKPNAENLCPTTNTGKLVGAIEDRIKTTLGIYRTNAVKCAPLDSAGKLRYPTEREMVACLPALRDEIRQVAPKVIVSLGGQVSRFLLQHLGNGAQFTGFGSDFFYDTYSLNFGQAMPIHHPSYIWVYRRKRVDEYVARVGDRLLELASR